MKPVIAVTRIVRDEEREADNRPLSLTLIRRLFGYTQPHARKRNWLMLTVVLRSLQLPALAWAIGAIINGPITRHDAHGVVIAACWFLAFAIFTQITFHFRQRLALELGESVIHDLRNELFRHYLRMPMSFFNRTKLGRILSRLTSDAEALRVGVQDTLFVSMVQGGQMIVAGMMMLWYDRVLFGVVVAMAPVLWLINRIFRQRLSVGYRQVQEAWSRVTATIAESVAGIRVTQGFARQDINAVFFSELMTDQSRYNVGVARTSAVFLPLLELNSQFFMAALLAVGGYRVLRPDVQMPVGTLVQFFFLANLFFDPIRVIGNMYNQALTAMAGAERVFHALDAKPEWEDAADAKELPAIQGRVEFRNVTFGYGTDRAALREVSFVVEPGQTIALVGHTGSGKSSMINLIAKFYLPGTGEVLIDGNEIRHIQADSLHRQMGIVGQQNFLFTGTIMDNIRVGRLNATDEEVVEAVRRLGFLDMIGTLPAGFATVVGERGAGLSMGQRQLICFARAFIADPRILILDEATSSVDALTEARIQSSLAKLLQGRTSFVVAHRLSTIRHADVVLVLEHGRIVERGRPEELLKVNGVYASLHRQFALASASMT